MAVGRAVAGTQSGVGDVAAAIVAAAALTKNGLCYY